MADPAQVFLELLPLSRHWGMQLEDSQTTCVAVRLPFDKSLQEAPETAIHPAVIAALLDTVSGAVVVSHPELMTMTATLNLRIDYLKDAKNQVDLIARADIEFMSDAVVHVRAYVHEDGSEAPIALAQGAFTV